MTRSRTPWSPNNLIQRDGSGRPASFHRHFNPQPGTRAGLHGFWSTIMTNDTPTHDPTFDTASWLAQEQARARLDESIRPENKAALFEALAQVGITTVLVEFDGYGDSGQIEDISAHAGPDIAVNLPERNVEIDRVEYGSLEIVRETFTVKEAFERLVYDFLEETHGGWEDNQGAYGDFLFDVAERTITLNYNERIETSEYTQHVF
jgi:hypothetical protein